MKKTVIDIIVIAIVLINAYFMVKAAMTYNSGWAVVHAVGILAPLVTLRG